MALAIVAAAFAATRCLEDTGPGPTSGTTCVLTAAIDGDSVRCADGREIRLLSIDAPEIAQSPWGSRSRAELLRVAPIRTVLDVEYDLELRDDFGRDLAYLFLPDGTMLNEHMVESGHALAFIIAPNRRHEARIRGAEASASQSRQGLWAVWGFPCKPVDFRRRRCSG